MPGCCSLAIWSWFPMFGDWLWFQIPIVALQILSRLGHMSYDVVGQQILQTGIPESKANLIGTTEVSVASLAESIMLGVAIVANDVSHFRFLAILSLLSVVGATWLFCRWLMNPTETQRSLFAFDSPKWCNVGCSFLVTVCTTIGDLWSCHLQSISFLTCRCCRSIKVRCCLKSEASIKQLFYEVQIFKFIWLHTVLSVIEVSCTVQFD